MVIIDKLEMNELLWFLCWESTSMLTQALYHMQRSKSEANFAQLWSRLRVSATGD